MSPTEPIPADRVGQELRRFLGARLKAPVPDDLDLFASGTVTSMFAMELVVHLEQAFGVEIVGPDLVLDNFRTIDAMCALVLRLRGTHGA